jgi:Carboxypeptidase regulatory-like domain/TonB dependent receptor
MVERCLQNLLDISGIRLQNCQYLVSKRFEKVEAPPSMPCRLLLCRFSAALFLLVIPLAAQYTTASLGGTITDSSGALVPQAKATVIDTQTGLTRTAQSGADGSFLFSGLPVGVYDLIIEKAGFQNYRQLGITLTVGQAATQAVVLSIGQANQSVTVSSEASMIETRDATLSQLVSEKRVLDLPLNGRQAQSLVFLAAGTVDVSTHYLTGQGGRYPGEIQAAVNGGGPGGVNFQLDGAGHNDTYLNSNLPFPNPDAVQEFSLQTSNLSAQYGNSASGVVNIVTKSGTNQFHGDLFEFLRNGALNARNFFAPVADSLKRNQFGGSIGGPVLKDKLFFFGTYQGTRIRSAAQGEIAQVPTAAERNGDFSAIADQLHDPVSGAPFAGNHIPASQFSTPALFFLKSIPLPNGPGTQLTYAGPSVVQNDNQYLAKIDYIHRNHTLSGHYFYSNFGEPPFVAKSNILAADNKGNQVRVQSVALNYTYSKSAALLFNTWFGWNEQVGGSLSSAPFGFPDAGIQIAAPNPPELSLSVGGYFGIFTSHKGDFDRGDWTIREDVTKVIRGHELHLGGEAVRVRNDLVNTFSMAGEFDFVNQLSGDNLSDFLLGRASTLSQGGGEFKNLVGTRWSAYAQDNWRVGRKLALNLGLRWDPFWPYKETAGRIVCFHPGEQSQRFPNAPQGLIFGGADHDTGCPASGANSDLGNFAPRLGFAYRPDGSGKTVVRGGAGIYYIPPMTTQYNAYADVAPFAPRFNLTDVSFVDPYASAGIANPFPAQYGPSIPAKDVGFTLPVSIRWYFPNNFQISQLATWNLTLERQLGSNWIVRAAYVGNKGTHLSNAAKGYRETNPALYIPGQSTEANTQARRIYQDFSSIGLFSPDSNSHHDALQLTSEKRFDHGFSALVNYTWGKTIDDYGWDNPFSRSFNRGVSDDDIRQTFKFSGIWQIPRLQLRGAADKVVNGWELTSLLTWRTGFPFGVYSGLDNSFSGNGSDHAQFIGADLSQARLGAGRPHGQQIEQWFNTSLFVPNTVGTFGNTAKNILRAPRLFNTDFGLLKNIPIRERLALQFRAEFFNLFNNVNFDYPDNTASDGTFGQITSTSTDPRILQFALKLSF